MVGRCISYWNSPFSEDMLVFRGVALVMDTNSSSHLWSIHSVSSSNNMFKVTGGWQVVHWVRLADTLESQKFGEAIDDV